MGVIKRKHFYTTILYKFNGGAIMADKMMVAHQSHGMFGALIGILLLITGIFWLGNDLSWWNVNFPFWPLIVIVLGVLIILKHFKKCC